VSTIRVVATHEVVRQAYPRPPPEDRERLAMAVGRAIDGALSEFGHQIRSGRRPTQAGISRLAAELLDEALGEEAVTVDGPTRGSTLAKIEEVVRAYRGSEIAGLARPKTRVILIGEHVGVYAQPDYWDGRARFYEMKSFRADPIPPDVQLQLRLFQLAFPRLEAVLFCLDRHATPVAVFRRVIPPPTATEVTETLALAYRTALASGVEKVREYVEGPFVSYPAPP
jgi:hypothetical protein